MCVKLSLSVTSICICCVNLLNCLNLVFDLLIMSRLTYASPSWSGYLNVECVSTIQKLFTKSVKYGVTSKSYHAADIFGVHDKKIVFCYVYCVSGLTIACIICCRVTLNMILGIEDILSSWHVIILSLLGVILFFMCCTVHCKQFALVRCK